MARPQTTYGGSEPRRSCILGVHWASAEMPVRSARDARMLNLVIGLTFAFGITAAVSGGY